MNFAGKIIMGIAMFFMPIGLILAMQGNYFYTITSQDTINNLIDQVSEEYYTVEYKWLCLDYLNTSYHSLIYVNNLICQKLGQNDELCLWTKSKIDEIKEQIETYQPPKTYKELCLCLKKCCSTFNDITNFLISDNTINKIIENDPEWRNLTKKQKEIVFQELKEEFSKTKSPEMQISLIYSNVTCSSLVETLNESSNIACQEFGLNSEICLQTTTLSQQIEAQKNELYNKEVFNGISLSKMNSMFAIALPIGVIIFVVSVILVYIASRSFVTLSNSVFVTILSTGILFLILWYFGNMMLGNMIPSEIAEHMPNALNSFIREIFQFEYLNGLVLSIIGAVGFAITMAVKKIKK